MANNDAWEQIRHLTLDQLVTQTKLMGASAAQLNGVTTPEKWPFVLVITIGGPGNELALDAAQAFHDMLRGRARWSYATAKHEPRDKE